MTDTETTAPVFSGLDATIEMHPHPTGNKAFVCYCGKAHEWSEHGTHTFRIPQPRWDSLALGFQMIRCPCGTWHMKAIPAETAVPLIKAQEAA